jgi:hypothetical protein
MNHAWFAGQSPPSSPRRTTHVHGRPFLHRRRSLGPPRWMQLANRHRQVPGWEPPIDVTMFCGRNANESDGYRAPPVIGWSSRIRRTPGHLTVPGWEPPMDVTMPWGRNANERDGYGAPPVIGWSSRIRRAPGHLTVPVRRVASTGVARDSAGDVGTVGHEHVWYDEAIGWGTAQRTMRGSWAVDVRGKSRKAIIEPMRSLGRSQSLPCQGRSQS